MATTRRQEIAKKLISEGHLKEFKDIFLYVTKTEVAEAMGIGYTRFLKLVRDPKPLRYREIYTLAGILNVPARSISELIHNQVDSRIAKGLPVAKKVQKRGRR